MGTSIMYIVLRLYSRISLCISQASPLPRQSETKAYAQLSNTVVESLGWSRWGHPTNSAVTLNSSYDIISIYQRDARTNECKMTLIVSDCVMNDFIISGIIFMAATRLNNLPQSFWRLDSFTVAFRGGVCEESGLRKLASIYRKTRLGHLAFLKKMLACFLKYGVK